MRRKLTITIDDDVYRGLHQVVGKRKISGFLSDFARPHVVRTELEAGYRAMAADEEREHEATEWIEGLIGDLADEPRRRSARRGLVGCVRSSRGGRDPQDPACDRGQQ
jgi:predicted CopG family antitoxin